MIRRLFPLLLTALLALAGCSKAAPFDPAHVPPAPDYAQPSAWLAFPGRDGIERSTSPGMAAVDEASAPADVFFSADIDWMDYLQTRKLIQTATRHDVLGNRLVLIAPAASTVRLQIAPRFALVNALGTGRLATGDPDSVPVGRYAKQALTALGVWSAVEGHIVGAENVRAALAFVERGEAPLGIVYKTDALVDKGVRIVDTFPTNTHPPITYPIALTVGAKGGAAQFADYIRTPAADAVFTKYGFSPLH